MDFNWFTAAGATVVLTLEYTLKVIAVGTVPENRRPAAASAWLLLIMFIPLIGFPLYWLIGQPYLKGRRYDLQLVANERTSEWAQELPPLPPGAEPGEDLQSLIQMNRRLTGQPCVSGTTEKIFPITADYFQAIADAIDQAEHFVHVEFYIVSWDEATDPVFEALRRAKARGVEVRLLLDHIGSRKYPGRKTLGRRMSAAGIEWHLMMPINPFKGRWRRPDLRNHRKLLVIDGAVGFMGSHNLIDPAYGSAKNLAMGRAWSDVSVQVTGDVVTSLSHIFATDWYAETDEMLDQATYYPDQPDHAPGGRAHGMQVVPSGPGFPTEPNMRMFVQSLALAQRNIAITSPYFVPNEALLNAITSAAHRGVTVDLFVGEEADQFLVGHAQRSYYGALLKAGVRIHLYPAPTVLHGKYFTIDDRVAVIGSSNMDYRSFALTYEVMMLAFGGDLIAQLQENDAHYRAVSHLLTTEEWQQVSWGQRYVNNVCRLTAALM
ncbi:cardiolipin synthase [Demetria terragena]|uniref:cardiolipin synthase n=1 Tax=Demetria terragena TaxID=63959 RepID=UPI00036C3BC1|nr:cardiolipin synthase [Demetria terragena]